MKRHLWRAMLLPAVGALFVMGCPSHTHGEEESYPLDTCVVSGEKLGKMGDPVVIQHEGQEVRFCCAGCVGQFYKDPEKYLAKIRDAKEARKAEDAKDEHEVNASTNENQGGLGSDTGHGAHHHE